MVQIRIGRKVISDSDLNPYVIAEIGVNYYEIADKLSLELVDAAKLMIKRAKDSGADAVKFQIYKADRLASKNAVAYWDLKENPVANQLELFKKYDKLNFNDYEELAKYATNLCLDFIATPFDEESAKFVAQVSPAIKISSSDINNIPFLKLIARFSKPILLSTGAANVAEIYKAVSTIRENAENDIVLLHCILEYPVPYRDANLNMIRYLKSVFPDFIIGYSDHTLPDENMLLLTVAILLGARVIEKHFTLDKSLPGNDHFHAMDAEDLKKFKKNVGLIQEILGRYTKEPLKGELISRLHARRSVFAIKDLKPGDIITQDNIAIKRPATGIPPEFLDTILGKSVKKKVEKDQAITWDHLL